MLKTFKCIFYFVFFAGQLFAADEASLSDSEEFFDCLSEDRCIQIIDHQDVLDDDEQELGHGTYSTVQASVLGDQLLASKIYNTPRTITANCLQNGIYCAPKDFFAHLENLTGEDDSQSELEEIGILAQLNHPNIIKCIGVSLSYQIVVVMHMPRAECDLDKERNVLAQKSREEIKKFLQEDIFDFCDQILSGLAYLHAQIGKFHCDVKEKNVLLNLEDGKTICRLADIGEARDKKQIEKVRKQGGVIYTVTHRPPEVSFWGSEEYKGKPVVVGDGDAFAFAVIFIDLFRQKAVFLADDPPPLPEAFCQLFASIGSPEAGVFPEFAADHPAIANLPRDGALVRELRSFYETHRHFPLVEIIIAMLNPNPEKRLSVRQARKKWLDHMTKSG